MYTSDGPHSACGPRVKDPWFRVKEWMQHKRHQIQTVLKISRAGVLVFYKKGFLIIYRISSRHTTSIEVLFYFRSELVNHNLKFGNINTFLQQYNQKQRYTLNSSFNRTWMLCSYFYYLKPVNFFIKFSYHSSKTWYATDSDKTITFVSRQGCLSSYIRNHFFAKSTCFIKNELLRYVILLSKIT